MTEEMIRSITDAEATAAEIKRAATEQSAQILAAAEEEATAKEKACVERLKAHRETEINAAKVAAEAQYETTLTEKRKQAKIYCADVLKNADDCISEIVGRIVRGDC